MFFLRTGLLTYMLVVIDNLINWAVIINKKLKPWLMRDSRGAAV
jgi:hypothetical protein